MPSGKHYDWTEGPAELDPHSLTKHSVLADYIRRYIEQRTLNGRGREVFKVTLVDGFCGGGLYHVRGQDKLVDGSPLRMLQAVEEARQIINADRTKPIDLQVQYVFVDVSTPAVRHLEALLRERGYEAQIGKTIHLINSEFSQASDRVMALVDAFTPRAGKAIFFLDQYGYTDVPAPLITKILNGLSNSEVVLTFHVASFATYTNDDFTDHIEQALQIDIRAALQGRTIEQIKGDDADWRRFIQGALYQALVSKCGATFFTPFFIRGEGSGHGEYWLVHLSRHPRAQDVMKQVHWKHHNHFVHYGGAGLNMLAPQTMGFMQKFDGGFSFDDVAEHRTDTELLEQLPRYIQSLGRPITVGELFASTCNGSPATSLMYKRTLEGLVGSHDVVVTSQDGRRLTQARYMTDADVVEWHRQVKLL